MANLSTSGGKGSFTLSTDAFRLLLFCLAALVLLYIADTLLVNSSLQSSNLLANLFELFRLLTTTLLGYLFAGKVSSG